MKKKHYILLITGIIVIGSIVILLLPPSRFNLRGSFRESKRIYDRNGILLREIIGDEGGVMRWASVDSINTFMIEAAIFSEDRHFYSHPGIDIGALLRAFTQLITKRRFISGGSTITMQVARLSYPIRHWNTFMRKIAEIMLALKIDLWLTKDEIMEIYLNRVYFGNMLYGIEAASQCYYGKSPAELSEKEVLILINSIQAPSTCNPLHTQKIIKKADRMAQMMYENGLMDDSQMRSYSKESNDAMPIHFTFRAPHVTDRIIYEMNGREWREVYSTIDIELQESLEKTIKTTLKQFENRNLSNGGIIVIHAQSGAILALVGSMSYFDDSIDGQFNTVYGFRSPGSSLKPFTYALGLMNGYNACTMIKDEPLYFSEPFGDYKPENYDFKFHGDVPFRQALGCSYNIPAVKVLNSIGYNKLYTILMKMGFNNHGHKAEHYGLAITLGSMSVDLYHLANAYTLFPNLGVMKKARLIDSVLTVSNSVEYMKSDSIRIIPQWTAFIIADILTDNNARMPAFEEENPFKLPFYAGVKTGTSKNYKDNLSLGFTGNYVIGVWAGNNNNQPMLNVSGITGAGVLFRHTVMEMYERYELGLRPSAPDSIVLMDICTHTGLLAGSECRNTRTEYIYKFNIPDVCHQCSGHDSNNDRNTFIEYPDNGDIFVIAPDIDINTQAIRISVKGLRDEDELFIDGTAVSSELWILKPGVHIIIAKRDGEIIDSIQFEVR